MKKETLIFDLDGTLVDAKELHHVSFEWALQQQDKSFKLTDDKRVLTEGLPTLNKVKVLNQFGYDFDAEKVYYDKQTHTDLHIHMVSWNKGLPSILNKLSEKYNMAIVSNARGHFVYSVVSLMNITKFDLILPANFFPMNNRKPSPFPFNTVIQSLEVDPEFVTIYEDSPTGITAAKNSIAKTVIEVKNSDDTYAHLEKLL